MVDTDVQLGAANCLAQRNRGTPIYKSNPSLVEQLVYDIIIWWLLKAGHYRKTSKTKYGLVFLTVYVLKESTASNDGLFMNIFMLISDPR